MTKLLSATLIAAAMLATPAMARENHVKGANASNATTRRQKKPQAQKLQYGQSGKNRQSEDFGRVRLRCVNRKGPQSSQETVHLIEGNSLAAIGHQKPMPTS